MNVVIYRWFILPNIIIHYNCYSYSSGTFRLVSDIDRHMFGIVESCGTCRSVFHRDRRNWRWLLWRRLREF